MNELKENICILDNLINVIKESKEIRTNVEHYKYLELKLSILFGNKIKLNFDVDNYELNKRTTTIQYESIDKLIKTNIYILESKEKLQLFCMDIQKESEKKYNKIIYTFDNNEKLVSIICKYNNALFDLDIKFSKESFIVLLKDSTQSIIKRQDFLSPQFFLNSELTDLLLIKNDLNIEKIESKDNMIFLFSKFNNSTLKQKLNKK